MDAANLDDYWSGGLFRLCKLSTWTNGCGTTFI